MVMNLTDKDRRDFERDGFEEVQRRLARETARLNDPNWLYVTDHKDPKLIELVKKDVGKMRAYISEKVEDGYTPSKEVSEAGYASYKHQATHLPAAVNRVKEEIKSKARKRRSARSSRGKGPRSR